MKTFLFLLVLLAFGAAGYEYFQHTQEAANYIEQRQRFGPGLTSLKAENQDLLAQQTALTQKLTNLQNQAAQLKEEISNAQDSSTTPPATPATPPAQ